MPVFWSPSTPTIEKPGGVFWWAQAYAHATATMQAMRASLLGQVPMLGPIAAQLKPMAASMAGYERPEGGIAAAFQRPLAALAGASPPSGFIAAQQQPMAAALVGGQTQLGAIGATMGQPVAALTGQELEQGTVAAAAQKMTAALNGEQRQTGAIAAAALPMSAALAGVEHPRGAIAAALQHASAAISGSQTQSGAMAASLQKATAALNAVQSQEGTLSASLSQAVAALAGNVTAANPVAFDKVTAGPTSTSFTSGLNISFSHTPVAAANVGVVVAIEVVTSAPAGNDALDPATTTVSYGGVPMTRLGAVWAGSSTSPANGKGIWFYGLTSAANTAQGASAHTISIVNSSPALSVAGSAMTCMTFTNILAFGTPTTTFVSGTTTGAKSIVLSSAASRIAVGGFIKGGTSALTAWTAFNQTQRFNTVTNGFSNTMCSAYCGGTAAGAASVTFTATTSGTISDGWGAIAFDIQ